MSETFNVYATIKHGDGQVEKRRLWLENFTTREEAERFARLAVEHNPGVVIRAWVEAGNQRQSRSRAGE
jgi:hypothetical protein